MYFGNEEEEERDPFEVFGEIETADEAPAQEDLEDAHEDVVDTAPERENEPAVVEYDHPEAPAKVKTGFSWAGFMGGLAALVWIVGAIGGPISYFGLNNVMAMDPAMQAGLIALAFGPALLFWVTASAAGEALKTRRLAVTLTQLMQGGRSPFEASEADVQRLSDTVKTEIETLNGALSSALDRLAELETAARNNAALFNEAVSASQQSTADMS